MCSMHIVYELCTTTGGGCTDGVCQLQLHGVEGGVHAYLCPAHLDYVQFMHNYTWGGISPMCNSLTMNAASSFTQDRHTNTRDVQGSEGPGPWQPGDWGMCKIQGARGRGNPGTGGCARFRRPGAVATRGPGDPELARVPGGPHIFVLPVGWWPVFTQSLTAWDHTLWAMGQVKQACT